MRLAAIAAAVVLATAVAVTAHALTTSGGAPARTHGLFESSGTTTGPDAIEIRRATPLRRSGVALRWAQVIRPTVARVLPGGRRIAAVAARTPEHTANLLVVTGAVSRHGRVWAHVRLAVLPNGTTGWVPRSALGGYTFVRTRLVVDLERLDATLRRGGRAVFRAPIGTGTASAPTPRGAFYIRDRLTAFASPFYGPIAFGTSARSAVLTDWPDGGYIGIHGTDAPRLIPGRISHGCIRMRNRDIERLSRLMPVGTLVTIR